MSEIYILSEKRFKGAKNLPVIVFDYYDEKVDLSPYDALIFTSKNGVLALDRVSSDWRKYPVFSIGSATSETVRELGGKVVYEARSSYGDNFAQEIKRELKNRRVLFIRAKVVTSSLNFILRESGVILDEKILYETVCNDCKKLKQPPLGSYIIFSSPSTISCFFKCFEWQASYTAVVIGEKTASFMPKSLEYVLSKKQTISSCIALAKENITKKRKK